MSTAYLTREESLFLDLVQTMTAERRAELIAVLVLAYICGARTYPVS